MAGIDGSVLRIQADHLPADGFLFITVGPDEP